MPRPRETSCGAPPRSFARSNKNVRTSARLRARLVVHASSSATRSIPRVRVFANDGPDHRTAPTRAEISSESLTSKEISLICEVYVRIRQSTRPETHRRARSLRVRLPARGIRDPSARSDHRASVRHRALDVASSSHAPRRHRTSTFRRASLLAPSPCWSRVASQRGGTRVRRARDGARTRALCAPDATRCRTIVDEEPMNDSVMSQDSRMKARRSARPPAARGRRARRLERARRARRRRELGELWPGRRSRCVHSIISPLERSTDDRRRRNTPRKSSRPRPTRRSPIAAAAPRGSRTDWAAPPDTRDLSARCADRRRRARNPEPITGTPSILNSPLTGPPGATSTRSREGRRRASPCAARRRRRACTSYRRPRPAARSSRVGRRRRKKLNFNNL